MWYNLVEPSGGRRRPVATTMGFHLPAGGFSMPKGVFPRTTRPIPERFWKKVDKSGPIPAVRPDLGYCWLWTAGHTKEGYGQFYLLRHKVVAPRFAYELVFGPIAPGLQIDHLCKTPPCVNPAHLEPVTPRENSRRSNAGRNSESKKTHCPANHPYDLFNTHYGTDGARHCRTCGRDGKRKRYWQTRNLDEAVAEELRSFGAPEG